MHSARVSSLADEEGLDGKYHKRPRRGWTGSVFGGRSEGCSLCSPLVLVLALAAALVYVLLFSGHEVVPGIGTEVEITGGAGKGKGHKGGAGKAKGRGGKETNGSNNDAKSCPPCICPSSGSSGRASKGNEGDPRMDGNPLEDDAALGPVRNELAAPMPRQLTSAPYTFTLVNMATEQKAWLQRSLLNKQRYVRKHGYSWELHLETLAENDPVWSKIPAMELALFGVSSVPNLDLEVPPGHASWSNKGKIFTPIKGEREHWAWWLDIDTLVTNGSYTLDWIVDEAHKVFKAEHAKKGNKDHPPLEMILSRDCNGINAGSLFLRRSPWVQRFLALLWSLRDELPNLDKDKRSEQDAIVYLYERKQEIRDRTTFLPQYILNGNPEDIGCTEFFPDDSTGRTWQVRFRVSCLRWSGVAPFILTRSFCLQPGDFVWHIAGSWAHTDNIMERNKIKPGTPEYERFETSEYLFDKYWPLVTD